MASRNSPSLLLVCHPRVPFLLLLVVAAAISLLAVDIVVEVEAVVDMTEAVTGLIVADSQGEGVVEEAEETGSIALTAAIETSTTTEDLTGTVTLASRQEVGWATPALVPIVAALSAITTT